MQYEDINAGDILVTRWGNREAVVKAVSKDQWNEKLKGGKRKSQQVTVERTNGTQIVVDVRRLLTLSEAQKSPLSSSESKDERAPRLRKPGI